MNRATKERTDALLVPSTPLARSEVSALRDQLVAGVTGAVSGLPPGGLIEVGRRDLASPAPCSTSSIEPFHWKPAFVRRSLGLAAVQSCATGRFRNPADATVAVAEEAVAHWRASGWRTFHWEPWMAGLPSAARAVVMAEATTWATALYGALDWSRLASLSRFGGGDDLWTCPAPRTVRIRGRVEVRIDVGSLDGAPRSAGGALITVASGCPRANWAEEMALPALVSAMRWPTRPAPVRLLGLWPQAGEARMVAVDQALLRSVANKVVAAVGTQIDQAGASRVRQQAPMGADLVRPGSSTGCLVETDQVVAA